MSSLGAKVKEFLHSGDSEDAKRGDVDPNTPGSFPVEDMRSTEQQRGIATGSEHNKLHKPNDPRGWTEDEKTPRDAAYKDSEFGLGEARNQPSYDPSHQTTFEKSGERITEPHERMSESHEGMSEPQERTTQPHERTSERVGGPAYTGLEDSANQTSQQEYSRSTEPSPGTQEHPYWGDLPLSEAQNSGPGYDPAADEAKHRNKPAVTAPLESGTFTKRKDPSEATHHSSTHREGQQLPYENTSGSHLSSTQREGQQAPYDNTSGSHFKEGASVGAGAAAAGATAYELNKKHRGDERSEQVAPATSSTQPEQHKGRSFPLLGRDHKDKDKDTHHSKVKEDKHTHHTNEEDKHAKEPKPKHESKIGGLFHKSHKEDNNPEVQGDRIEDKPQSSKTNPPWPTAGVGGAAAYAATRDRHDERQHQDTTTTKEPKAKHDSKSGGLFHKSHKEDTNPVAQGERIEDKHHGSEAAALTTAGVGGAAAYGATRDRHNEGQPRDATTATELKEDKHAQEAKPRKDSKIGGLFHRSHKDKDETNPIVQDKPAEEQSSKTNPPWPTVGVSSPAAYYAASRGGHDDRQPRDTTTATELKQDQHVQEPKPRKNSKIGDLFHRGHKDKEETDPNVQQGLKEEKHHGSKAAPTMATAGAAGVAGAATYAATRGQHDDRQPRDTTTTRGYEDPNAPRGTDQLYSSDHPSQGDRQAGTSHLPIASQFASTSQQHDTTQRSDTGQPSNIGSSGAFASQSSQPVNQPIDSSTGQSHRSGNGQTYNVGSSGVLGSDSTQPANQYVDRSVAQPHQSGTGQPSNIGSSGAFVSQSSQPTSQYVDNSTGQSHRSGAGQPSNIASSGVFGSEGNQPQNQYVDNSAQSHRPEGSHTHRNAGLATGAAAGVGAGALASHEFSNRGQNDQYTTENTSRQYEPTQPGSMGTSNLPTGNTSRQYEPTQTGSMGTSNLARDTTAPVHTGTKHEPMSGSHGSSQRRSDDGLPQFTRNANEGKYEILASGTPSGLKTKDSTDDARRA